MKENIEISVQASEREVITLGKKKRVLLNQPISDSKADWIGVSTYVDKLEAAINSGAKMIAVTSDFGSGKSSLIGMLKKRYRWWKPGVYSTKIHSINLWSNLEKHEEEKKEEQDSRGEVQDGYGKIPNSVELHKSFLFHLISQINPRKGSYMSKRLSKNFGLFKIQSNSTLNTILVVLAFGLIMFGELLRRFGNDVVSFLPFVQNRQSVLEYISFCLGFAIALFVACKSDFLFSSTKSEGKRELDENILIDYYNQEILFHGFLKHHVFVIEDIDRTNDIDSVVIFLKEIRKYYLMSDSIRGILHHNRVTFIVNIKPEALLSKGMTSEKNSKEKLFPKFFDYIIEMRKINIDNYDSILNGLLTEISEDLMNDGLVNDTGNISVNNIPGMQWIIRGKKLDIREIKERLNKALTLYEALRSKFDNNNDTITFEKCAVSVYVSNEFASDYYKIGDRDFEELIELSIVGTLSVTNTEWPKSFDDVSPEFKSAIVSLIENKLIDTNYRIYFYNYPRDSKLYNMSESVVNNAILYDDKSYEAEKFEIYLKETSEQVIYEALDKVVQLGLELPKIVLEYEKFYTLAVNKYPEKVIELVGSLSYEQENMAKTISIVEKFVVFDRECKTVSNNFHMQLADLWNEKIESKSNLILIRKMLCQVIPDKIINYLAMYENDNPFVSLEEIKLLNDYKKIIPLINYDNMQDKQENCKLISKILLEQLEKSQTEFDEFYVNCYKTYGISETLVLLQDYCRKIKSIPSKVNDILLQCINNSEIQKSDYIDIVSDWDNFEENVLETLNEIQWYDGGIEKAYQQMYDSEYYLFYVCNLISDQLKIDFADSNIQNVICEKADFLFASYKEIFSNLRLRIVKEASDVNLYKSLFGEELPILSKSEINCIEDVDLAIDLLKENKVTIEETGYIAEYFSNKYRNLSVAYNILLFVAAIDDEVVMSELFYALNMENVRYRAMAAQKKSDILNKISTKLELDLSPENRLKYMIHVHDAISSLEKDLYKYLIEDDDMKKKYTDFISGLEKVSAQTIKNINNIGTTYAYSPVIHEELYKRKYYEKYVVSKTLYDSKFAMEEERKQTLWDTYVLVFLSDGHEYTRKRMLQNRDFMTEIINRKSFMGVIKNVEYFANALQSVELLKYVFNLEDWDGLEEYLSGIYGFDSKESAEYFLDQVIKNDSLLISSSVYNNTHDKLVDGGLKGRYTKARKKLIGKEN